MNRILQAAAVVAQLPAKIAARLSGSLEAGLVSSLAEALSQFPNLDADSRKSAVMAFALELQARTRQAPTTLNIRGLSGLCQAHPTTSRTLLAEWLAASGSAQPSDEPKKKAADPSNISSLTPMQKIFIFLRSLDDRISAAIYPELDPELLKALTQTVLRRPRREVVAAVLQELEENLNLRWRSLTEAAEQEPAELAHIIGDWLKLTQARPAPARSKGHRRKLLSCPRCSEIFVDQDDFEKHLATHDIFPVAEVQAQARLRAATIVLMTMKPEASALVYKELSTELAASIAKMISQLPLLNPEFRQAVVSDFQKTFGLGNGGIEQLEELTMGFPDRVAGHLLQWIGAREGFALVCGEEVLPYMRGSYVAHNLETMVHELEACWLRQLPMPSIIESGAPGYDVAFCWNERPLVKVTLYPNKALIFEPEEVWVSQEVGKEVRARQGRVEFPIEVLRRCLGIAMAELDEDSQEERDLPLSTDGVAAMAVLRAFHPNLLAHELGELKGEGLSSVASGLIELLTISTESLSECLRLSVNFSPGELLEQAKLVSRGQQYGGAQKVAILLYMLPNPKTVLKALFASLTPPQAVLVTEKLARLVFRREDRAMSPREELAALGELADWRASTRRPPAIPSFGQNVQRLLKTIPQVWPIPKPEEIREEFLRLGREQPEMLSDLLAQYMTQRPSAPWLPGPLRAAHFLNGLGNRDELRTDLAKQGYPLPRVGLNLELTRQARKEWLLRARTLTMN